MKTTKTINTFITLVVLSVFFVSCVSDEQKALNYIKTEVLPEESIENYLMAYNAEHYNIEFWKNLGAYLDNVCDPNRYVNNAYDISLSHGYGHYYTLPYSGDRRSLDYWTYGSRHGYVDSQKILQSICEQVSETVMTVVKSDTVERFECGSGEFDSYAYIETVYDAVLYEAVNFRGFHTSAWTDRIKMEGIENTSENIEKYKYEWTAKTPKQQHDFIVSLSRYLVRNARAMVRSNEFKLVDTQSIKTGETTYQVVYLLEPKLKIVFDVSKIGNTFSCDKLNVDGDIDWKWTEVEENEDDLI